MKILRKIFIVLLVLLGLFPLLAGGAGVYVNGKYGVFTAAPAMTHTQATSAHPTFRAVVDPVLAAAHADDFFEELAGQTVPPWLVEYFMPGEVSLILTSDHDSASVLANLFVNEKRLGPLFADRFNGLDVPAMYPQFEWAPEGMELPERGHLSVEASFPMEPSAQDAVLNDGWWTHGRMPAPFHPVGGHLLEIVGDNRRGGAYLAAASLMHAFGYDLNAQMKDVSITSFIFVDRVDFYVDVAEDGRLLLYLSFDIQEGKENRIAVVNLRAGLNEAFDMWRKALAEEHDLTLEGGDRWEGAKLVFEFSSPEANSALRALLKKN